MELKTQYPLCDEVGSSFGRLEIMSAIKNSYHWLQFRVHPPLKMQELVKVPVLRAASCCSSPQDLNDDIQHSKHCKWLVRFKLHMSGTQLTESYLIWEQSIEFVTSSSLDFVEFNFENNIILKMLTRYLLTLLHHHFVIHQVNHHHQIHNLWPLLTTVIY